MQFPKELMFAGAVLLLLISMAMWTCSCSLPFWENVAEEVIEQETGVDIDLNGDGK